MAINLGTAAFEAITNLKNSSDWQQVVTALNEQMSQLLNRAVEVPPEQRVDATGYARALLDLVAFIEQVYSPLPGNRTPKPVIKALPR